jgi:hypothetical protein
MNLKTLSLVDTYKRFIGNFYLHLQGIFIHRRNRAIVYSSVLIGETVSVHLS